MTKNSTDYQSALAGPPRKKRHWVLWTVVLFAGIIALSMALSNGGDPEPNVRSAAETPSAVQPQETTELVPETEESVEPAPEPEPEKPKVTVAQENALESAQSYVDLMGFSKAGLLDQLTSDYGEGFEKADAKWAVEHVDVDWKQEAVESAQSYLDLMSFSRSGLIDQLTSEYGDQFTKEQAEYAADQVGL